MWYAWISQLYVSGRSEFLTFSWYGARSTLTSHYNGCECLYLCLLYAFVFVLPMRVGIKLLHCLHLYQKHVKHFEVDYL